MRRTTTQGPCTHGSQGFHETWCRGGDVTHDCHVDGSLAIPRLAHPSAIGASPPLVSVVEASAGGPDRVAESCAISELRQGGPW